MNDSLVKVCFNLNADDVEWFKRRYGWGWSEQIRYLMRRERKELEKVDNSKPSKSNRIRSWELDNDE